MYIVILHPCAYSIRVFGIYFNCRNAILKLAPKTSFPFLDAYRGDILYLNSIFRDDMD